MKDKEIVCISYVCKNETCLKNRKNVTLKKCQTCNKYEPRKIGNPKKESLKTRKEKSKNKQDLKEMKQY